MTDREKRVRLTLLGPCRDKNYEVESKTPEKEVSEVVERSALKESI